MGFDNGTTRKHVAFLFLFSILVYFVGNGSLTITDPVESNYTETAKEMLAPGGQAMPQALLDKHVRRKHGPHAYYGQKKKS